MEVFMNDREFSDIEIFQHSGKGISLFMTDHKNCLQDDYNNGRRILCSQNWTKYMLQMSVTNQQVSIKKIFPLNLKIKAVCIRFLNLVILNTVSS